MTPGNFAELMVGREIIDRDWNGVLIGRRIVLCGLLCWDWARDVFIWDYQFDTEMKNQMTTGYRLN